MGTLPATWKWHQIFPVCTLENEFSTQNSTFLTPESVRPALSTSGQAQCFNETLTHFLYHSLVSVWACLKAKLWPYTLLRWKTWLRSFSCIEEEECHFMYENRVLQSKVCNGKWDRSSCSEQLIRASNYIRFLMWHIQTEGCMTPIFLAGILF